MTVATAPTCTHHWLIEMANGEFSLGICQHCGASGAFRNSTPPECDRIGGEKMCRGCKVTFPRTAEYFPSINPTELIPRLRSRCHDCHRAGKAAYRYRQRAMSALIVARIGVRFYDA